MNKFSLATKANSVYRWAGQHLFNKRASIGEHSYEVTLCSMFLLDSIVHLIQMEIDDGVLQPHAQLTLRLDVLEHGLFHDIPEVFTGDIPYPVKAEYPELKEKLSEIEADFMQAHLPEMVKERNPIALLIVKLADVVAVRREIEDELNVALTQPMVQARENTNKILKETFIKYGAVDLHIREALAKAMYDTGYFVLIAQEAF